MAAHHLVELRPPGRGFVAEVGLLEAGHGGGRADIIDVIGAAEIDDAPEGRIQQLGQEMGVLPHPQRGEANVVLLQVVPAAEPHPGYRLIFGLPEILPEFLVSIHPAQRRQIRPAAPQGAAVLIEKLLVVAIDHHVGVGLPGGAEGVFQKVRQYFVVRVHIADVLTPCVVEAKVPGRPLAAVFFVQRMDAGVLYRIFVAEFSGAVGAAVVHQPDLEVLPGLGL